MKGRRSFPRRFAIIGAAVCTIVLAAFAAVDLTLAQGRLERMAEAGNTALTQAMATLLERDHGAFLARASTLTPGQIAADPEIPRLHGAIVRMMAQTSVVKVKIYDARGIAVFSTDAKQIGEDKSANAGFRSALAGQVASIIVHRDRFDAFEQTIENRDLISSYVPFRFGAERHPGVFEIYSDITAFKQEVIRAVIYEGGLLFACFAVIYGALLATVIVADRTLAREHAKNLTLAASVARAEAASEQKSQFLATMSHELRTPLNAIIGFSDVMSRGVFGPIEPARYRDYAGDILKSGIHLLGLVSDILEFSKGEAGQFSCQIGPVNAAATVHEAAEMLRVKAEAGGLTLVVEADPMIGEIRTDASRLRQILINLISNAIKFTPTGGRVVVGLSRGADQGIVLKVSDTGIGIAAEDIPICLAPFGQMEGSHTRTHGGAGLGLPLAQKFAEVLGGGLAIESAPGQGTTVTVWLPLARAAMPVAAA